MYVCYDNEGYMNTGNQRSSMTPLHAATATTPVGKVRGKPTVSKYLPLIMALHPVAYVATATLSNMEDYAKKLLKAKEKSKEGFAYIHVFAPCIIGSDCPAMQPSGLPHGSQDQLFPALGDGKQSVPLYC